MPSGLNATPDDASRVTFEGFADLLTVSVAERGARASNSAAHRLWEWGGGGSGGFGGKGESERRVLRVRSRRLARRGPAPRCGPLASCGAVGLAPGLDEEDDGDTGEEERPGGDGRGDPQLAAP